MTLQVQDILLDGWGRFGWLETMFLQVPTCLIGNPPMWTTDVVETADEFP